MLTVSDFAYALVSEHKVSIYYYNTQEVLNAKFEIQSSLYNTLVSKVLI